MGYKSRAHWAMNTCIKFDCANRDKLCNECIAFSQYPKKGAKEVEIVKSAHKIKPTRGDFEVCRICDENHLDYNRFKNPQDRKKITTEYFQKQKEYRDKLISKGVV